MATSPARSLRTGTTYKTRWYPIAIETWEEALIAISFNGRQVIKDHDIRRNLAYNLQYLEYIEQTIVELSLSAVLTKQTYKSYIIVAIGIVESILYHLNMITGGTEHNFFKILTALESSAMLGKDRPIYDDLQKFRKLRNKVHIYELRDGLGTDYASFEDDEFNQMRKTLFDLLTSSILALPQDKADLFKFLCREVVIKVKSSETTF